MYYDQVLGVLGVALGAAVFCANVPARGRRRYDARAAAEETVARSRPGSPVRGLGRGPSAATDLQQAPVSRSLTYAAIGFVVMVWGIASLVTG